MTLSKTVQWAVLAVASLLAAAPSQGQSPATAAAARAPGSGQVDFPIVIRFSEDLLSSTSLGTPCIGSTLPRLRGRLVRRVAQRRVQQSHPQMTAIARRNAETRIGNAFDASVTALVEQSNGDLGYARSSSVTARRTPTRRLCSRPRRITCNWPLAGWIRESCRTCRPRILELHRFRFGCTNRRSAMTTRRRRTSSASFVKFGANSNSNSVSSLVPASRCLSCSAAFRQSSAPLRTG